ncbi:type 2 lanthipeptide synthetase LanM family protein [Clostridium folliculivorans]|uniref:Bacteriocin formation protein n=1 Tax=Clostridium folliculivorans TaxID=2886038 RepID=A0A9W5Y503_9CLOT|nr:type 2 lanthipeptide synthetase LanM family protein [Clostridium folliculivorans]GKU26677.1 bacteriocin formation protein [Clostridium folliculivorans]GKU28891.1 bacteriocin formation protein [Clostridium folliculivorans]
MNRIFKDFENQDVINYWLSLFPNFNTEEELIDHVEQMLDIPFEKCGNQNLFFPLLYSHVDNRLKLSISNEQKKQIDECMRKNIAIMPIYLLYQDIVYANIGELMNTINNSNLIGDKISFISSVLSQLDSNLSPYFMRTVVLELNCAREDGLLKGNDSKQRYEYFINTLLSDSQYRTKFYNEYKTLFCISSNMIQNYFDYIQDIIINTESEIKDLDRIFLSNGKLGEIKDIEVSMGDVHCDGKTVAIIHFQNVNVVYKPRDMKLDLQFQEFLKWVNSKNIIEGIQLSITKIHTTKNCGWMEYVEQIECDSQEKVNRFYTKSGILLGILYCFNAVDFHFENIIAHEEDPVLVDLETLFHPKITDKSAKNKDSGFQTAIEFIYQSVAKIGLLPTRMRVRKDDKIQSIDVGALSESKNQNSILKSLVFENLDSDNLSLSYEYLPVDTKKNAPKLLGQALDPKKFMDYLLDGFKSFYLFAQKNKTEMLDFTISTFAECQIRIILKSTVTYTSLLNIASHPDFMRQPIHRLILLSKIGANDYYDINIKRFELSELCRNQVPYFYTSFESHDLKGYPNICFSNSVERNTSEILSNKLNNLSLIDMQIQISLIKDAFFVRNSENDITGITFNYESDSQPRPNEWLRFSEDIADHLHSRSFKGINDDGQVDRAYVGAQTLMTDSEDWNVDVDSLDLYDGNSGTALFFIYLWKISGNEQYRRYAIETIQPVVQIVNKRNEIKYEGAIGAYKGLGGLAYALNKITLLTGDSLLSDSIDGVLDLIEQNIDEDVNFDFIGGGIGCLAALLSIYQKPYNQALKNRALSLSIRIYEFLKNKFLPSEYGKVINLNKERIGSGFAHGTAGFAPYLYKLYTITSNNEILELLQNILEYERHIFYSSNMPGWHSSLQKSEMDISWCSGVCGILLSKLLLKEYGYHDEMIDNEIELAFDLSIKNSFGHNLPYCHGDLSALTIIRYYSKVMNNAQVEVECLNVFQQLFDRVKDDWKSDKKTLNRFNGLMLGASGLGFAMLKQYDYDNVDEFLWLV